MFDRSPALGRAEVGVDVFVVETEACRFRVRHEARPQRLVLDARRPQEKRRLGDRSGEEDPFSARTS